MRSGKSLHTHDPNSYQVPAIQVQRRRVSYPVTCSPNTARSHPFSPQMSPSTQSFLFQSCTSPPPYSLRHSPENSPEARSEIRLGFPHRRFPPTLPTVRRFLHPFWISAIPSPDLGNNPPRPSSPLGLSSAG